MYTIAGLGNPGASYTQTRHNAGFLAIERLQELWGFPKFSFEKKWNAEISRGVAYEQDILLVKPMTFMNRSGGPLSLTTNFYKIPPEQIIVLHDEIDLPNSKIKYKMGGGHAGHNGLRDIIAKLGSKDFHRIRIGVDRPNEQGDVTQHVLGKFTAQEKIQINNEKDKIIDLIQEVFNGEK